MHADIIPNYLTIETNSNAGTMTVTLQNSEESNSHFELQKQLSRVLRERPMRLIYDVSELQTIGASVIGMLVGCSRDTIQRGRPVTVNGARGMVREALLQCQLDTIFEGLRD